MLLFNWKIYLFTLENVEKVIVDIIYFHILFMLFYKYDIFLLISVDHLSWIEIHFS